MPARQGVSLESESKQNLEILKLFGEPHLRLITVQLFEVLFKINYSHSIGFDFFVKKSAISVLVHMKILDWQVLKNCKLKNIRNCTSKNFQCINLC